MRIENEITSEGLVARERTRKKNNAWQDRLIQMSIEVQGNKYYTYNKEIHNVRNCLKCYGKRKNYHYRRLVNVRHVLNLKKKIIL